MPWLHVAGSDDKARHGDATCGGGRDQDRPGWPGAATGERWPLLPHPLRPARTTAIHRHGRTRAASSIYAVGGGAYRTTQAISSKARQQAPSAHYYY